jgi:transposase
LILGEVGNVARFPNNDHFASYTGTAPLDASSGEVVRHRLSRAGNRRLNHALHIAAMVHKRYDPRGRDYYARKLAAGKGSKGALRCLKRRLSDAVFRRLLDDQTAKVREGQAGATRQSSATDLIPMASTSEQPLPGRDADLTTVTAAVS